MNDRRFIELLNLYVDNQLDPADAAELEAEVLRSPSRRRTYDQYCRLQRGCCLLGDGARSLAPASDRFARSLREAERKIAAPRQPTWRIGYVGLFSATAMAACVAVVLVVNRPAAPALNSQDELVSRSVQSVATPVIGTPQAPADVAVASTAVSAFDFHPVLVTGAYGVARTAREAEIAASDREALEWMQRVELLPIPRLIVDEQAFEGRPTLQQDNRVFRSRRSIQGNAEFAAFQFQR